MWKDAGATLSAFIYVNMRNAWPCNLLYPHVFVPNVHTHHFATLQISPSPTADFLQSCSLHWPSMQTGLWWIHTQPPKSQPNPVSDELHDWLYSTWGIGVTVSTTSWALSHSAITHKEMEVQAAEQNELLHTGWQVNVEVIHRYLRLMHTSKGDSKQHRTSSCSLVPAIDYTNNLYIIHIWSKSV